MKPRPHTPEGHPHKRVLDDTVHCGIAPADLLAALQQSPHARRAVHGVSAGQLGKRLKKWFKDDLHGERPRGEPGGAQVPMYWLPKPPDMRRLFAEKTGIVVLDD